MSSLSRRTHPKPVTIGRLRASTCRYRSGTARIRAGPISKRGCEYKVSSSANSVGNSGISDHDCGISVEKPETA